MAIENSKISDREQLSLTARAVKEAKTKDKEREKPKSNEVMAREASDYAESFPFWCADCREDFTAEAYKEWHRIYGDAIAVYRAKHEQCGNECIRHITHKDEDPYYSQSEVVQEQRNQYSLDILQPNQYGYRNQYGDPWEKYEDLKIKKAEERFKAEREKGFKLSKK